MLRPYNTLLLFPSSFNWHSWEFSVGVGQCGSVLEALSNRQEALGLITNTTKNKKKERKQFTVYVKGSVIHIQKESSFSTRSVVQILTAEENNVRETRKYSWGQIRYQQLRWRNVSCVPRVQVSSLTCWPCRWRKSVKGKKIIQMKQKKERCMEGKDKEEEVYFLFFSTHLYSFFFA